MSAIHPLRKRIEFRPSLAGELLRRGFAPLGLLGAGAAVMAAFALSWAAWSATRFASPSSLELHLRLGLGAALLVAALSAARGEHRLELYLGGHADPGRTARTWNLAFALLIGLAFLTRRTDDLSRGAVALSYLAGFGALHAFRSGAARAAAAASRSGLLVARRILLVGARGAVTGFLRRRRPWSVGLQVVGTATIPAGATPEARRAATEEAVALARRLRPDDVYLALPWSDAEAVEEAVEAFMAAPVAVHLAPERVLDRFDGVRVARTGPVASLELTRPMPAAAAAAKRLFDLAAAGAALALLAPLLLLLALAIKLDSRGPALFFQTRYGFNQRPFRIVKLRTMTTFADEGDVPQARREDPRITRVGRFLRRTNLDELPQLLNVVAGHMSLVGPRPHAAPHNRYWERRIALYARRHNVRPGITGWAQVNGLRGETDTDDKMRRRVAHDLHYIDNWSPLLDGRIIARTLLSRAAYRNAR